MAKPNKASEVKKIYDCTNFAQLRFCGPAWWQRTSHHGFSAVGGPFRIFRISEESFSPKCSTPTSMEHLDLVMSASQIPVPAEYLKLLSRLQHRFKCWIQLLANVFQQNPFAKLNAKPWVIGSSYPFRQSPNFANCGNKWGQASKTRTSTLLTGYECPQSHAPRSAAGSDQATCMCLKSANTWSPWSPSRLDKKLHEIQSPCSASSYKWGHWCS